MVLIWKPHHSLVFSTHMHFRKFVKTLSFYLKDFSKRKLSKRHSVFKKHLLILPKSGHQLHKFVYCFEFFFKMNYTVSAPKTEHFTSLEISLLHHHLMLVK